MLSRNRLILPSDVKNLSRERALVFGLLVTAIAVLAGIGYGGYRFITYLAHRPSSSGSGAGTSLLASHEKSASAATASSGSLVLTKEKIAAAFDGPLNSNQFPETLDIPIDGNTVKKVQVKYTLDAGAQAHMEKLIAQYKPDYGAFVALDATTGRILSLVSYTRKPSDVGNLTLRSTFPAASVFKIVTATAAIDQKKMSPDSVIPFTGGLHTLYRRNVSQYEHARSKRMTLREAFAKSVNTVFAKIGLFILNPFQLIDYANRFQFNQSIAADVPVQPGRFVLAENDRWAVAEAASGFDKMILMSPVQGALISASVVNDGTMMAPHVVDSLTSPDGGAPLYTAEPQVTAHPMAPSTASELRALMRETVSHGTSRRSFRDFYRRKISKNVEVGGKTGHLTGIYPKGRYDWFVGYALSENRKIAVAALTINEELWRVKSSHLAKSFIENYFKPVEAE
jgi:cell division protein FtsI/penicillin-binding protein 2